MKMSDLSRDTGVPVATIKFYLRTGLLHSGRATSPNQAQYDDTHVERVRLVRALSDVGGLDLGTVRRVFDVADRQETARLDVLAAAQQALLGADDPAASGPRESSRPSRARDWVLRRGWRVAADDPYLDELDRAWAACDTADLDLDEARLDEYADAVERIAEIDVASVPVEPQAAVRRVVLGTVLLDPVLSTLRRLAQQHVSVVRDAGASSGGT